MGIQGGARSGKRGGLGPWYFSKKDVHGRKSDCDEGRSVVVVVVVDDRVRNQREGEPQMMERG